MGAPKQKWTAEEEAALKAGVIKHGAGKWRTILIDPEFNSILHQRSNVDLKDKWRNINVTAIWGSRQKAKLALKKNSLAIQHHDNPRPVQNEEIVDAQPLAISNGTIRTTKKNSLTIQHHDNPMPASTALQNEEIVDTKPLTVSNGTIRTTKKNSLVHHDNPMPVSTVLQNEEKVDAKPLAISNGKICTTKEPLARLDKLISEAIINLKELRGSDRAAIATYIEEHFWAPPNLKKLISTKLKHMTADGKLIKVKHKYKIAPNSTLPKRNVPLILLEDKQMDSSKAKESEVKIITKSQVDSELSKMKVMTAEEAAIAAARAVAEAEAAIAEAERAAREAEEAEAEAESAQVFAEAAMKALECRTLPSRSPIQKVLVQDNKTWQ